MRTPEPWYRLIITVLRPPVTLWFNWRFEGRENIPRQGPLLLACNHISYFDPLAHGLMLVKEGRRPRFMTKRELYGHALLRRVLEGSSQIPVDRGTGSSAPIEAARAALARGDAVIVYPEGTVTRNPDFSPMQGKTGIARLTLATGVPVVPLAVWGSHRVWQREGASSLAFGRPIWVKAGAPMDFSHHKEESEDPAVLREVTDSVMEKLSRLVADMRARYPKRWR